MSKIQLFENNSEIGAGTRGSSLGIEALKIASYNSSSNFFRKFSSKVISTQNHKLNETSDFPKAKRIDGIIDVCSGLSSQVSNALKKHHFPFVLSGDHSSAIGTIAGVKSANPSLRLGVIWIDAHADLHSPYTTPTGNVHGMSLMASLSQDNSDRRIHELDHLTSQQWEKLKKLENIYPKIHADDIVILGLRSTEDPEDYFIIDNKIKKIPVEHVRRNGAETVSKEVLDYLSDCDLLYISFDVDSLDCDLVSYGTGTPVPNGFTENEAAGLINNFLIDKRSCCFELVEINPCLDNKQNKMAETALRIIEHASSIVEKRG
jgi:arginase